MAKKIVVDKILKNHLLPEVTVYSKSKLAQVLSENELKIKKFLEDMDKYKKDSAQWAIANKGYQDSLKLFDITKAVANEDYKLWAGLPSSDQRSKDYYKKIIIDAVENPKKYEKRIIEGSVFSLDKFNKSGNYDDKLNPEDMAKWSDKMAGEYASNSNSNEKDINGLTPRQRVALHKRASSSIRQQSAITDKTGIQPTHIMPAIESPFRLIYKKPTKEPILPDKPIDESISVRYDPKYEDIRMRPLWANVAKRDRRDVIGTLNPLDRMYENGFTIDQAKDMPQEVKDRYNIDYILGQLDDISKGKIKYNSKY